MLYLLFVCLQTLLDGLLARGPAVGVVPIGFDVDDRVVQVVHILSADHHGGAAPADDLVVLVHVILRLEVGLQNAGEADECFAALSDPAWLLGRRPDIQLLALHRHGIVSRSNILKNSVSKVEMHSEVAA